MKKPLGASIVKCVSVVGSLSTASINVEPFGRAPRTLTGQRSRPANHLGPDNRAFSFIETPESVFSMLRCPTCLAIFSLLYLYLTFPLRPIVSKKNILCVFYYTSTNWLLPPIPQIQPKAQFCSAPSIAMGYTTRRQP